MKLRILLAPSAALALAACGEAEETTVADDTMADSGTLDTGLAADPGMPTNAQEFATMQAASDTYEIEAGRLAQENASDQAVQDFGSMMVEDHTASTSNLQSAAAQAQGITVDPQMTAEQQSNIEELRNAGEDFDSTYLDQQVEAHEKALEMLQNYAQNGDNPALQDFARQTAEVVQGHLQQARELQQQVQQ